MFLLGIYPISNLQNLRCSLFDRCKPQGLYASAKLYSKFFKFKTSFTHYPFASCPLPPQSVNLNFQFGNLRYFHEVPISRRDFLRTICNSDTRYKNVKRINSLSRTQTKSFAIISLDLSAAFKLNPGFWFERRIFWKISPPSLLSCALFQREFHDSW